MQAVLLQERPPDSASQKFKLIAQWALLNQEPVQVLGTNETHLTDIWLLCTVFDLH